MSSQYCICQSNEENNIVKSSLQVIIALIKKLLLDNDKKSLFLSTNHHAVSYKICQSSWRTTRIFGILAQSKQSIKKSSFFSFVVIRDYCLLYNRTRSQWGSSFGCVKMLQSKLLIVWLSFNREEKKNVFLAAALEYFVRFMQIIEIKFNISKNSSKLTYLTFWWFDVCGILKCGRLKALRLLLLQNDDGWSLTMHDVPSVIHW